MVASGPLRCPSPVIKNTHVLRPSDGFRTFTVIPKHAQGLLNQLFSFLQCGDKARRKTLRLEILLLLHVQELPGGAVAGATQRPLRKMLLVTSSLAPPDWELPVCQDPQPPLHKNLRKLVQNTGIDSHTQLQDALGSSSSKCSLSAPYVPGWGPAQERA